MAEPIYKEISQSTFSDIITKIDILLVTATKLEADILHSNLTSFDNSNEILMCYKGALTYYIGLFGKYKIIHVRSGMGSILRNSSIMTISEAINNIKPKLVFMIGIAFGVDDKEQNIGDVLVSESIIRYNFLKIENGKRRYRSNSPEANKTLLDRFSNLRNWVFKLPNKKISKIITAPILSGEELINDIVYRDELLSNFPQAKGGEMEGAGLYAACDENTEWILVKGICDFADGNKNVKKNTFQTIAMKAAVSACLNLFQSETAFDHFKIIPLNDNQLEFEINTNEVSKILYEVYDLLGLSHKTRLSLKKSSKLCTLSAKS